MNPQAAAILHFCRENRGKLIVAGVLATLLLIVVIFVPPIWQLKGGSVTVTRWLKTGKVEAEVASGKDNWIPIDKVSRHVLHAIVVAEDARFYDHFGLDLEEIVKSFELNLRKGRYVRGGSTITQQVIKMAFLSREKTILRKVREAIGALLVEKLLTKDEILEWYINLAEFGDNVYGIKAAAKHYFDTRVELLTIQHGVHLALVLPSPNSWSQGLRNKRLTPFGHRRYAKILNAMRQNGFITKALWLNSLANGDFGRPINGFFEIMARIDAEDDASLLTEEEAQKLEEELMRNDAFTGIDEAETPGEESMPEDVGGLLSDEIPPPAPVVLPQGDEAIAGESPLTDSDPANQSERVDVEGELPGSGDVEVPPADGDEEPL